MIDPGVTVGNQDEIVCTFGDEKHEGIRIEDVNNNVRVLCVSPSFQQLRFIPFTLEITNIIPPQETEFLSGN